MSDGLLRRLLLAIQEYDKRSLPYKDGSMTAALVCREYGIDIDLFVYCYVHSNNIDVEKGIERIVQEWVLERMKK